GRTRSQGNQVFQRSSEVSLALLVLLDAHCDLGLPPLQLTRFFVVFVLRNALVEPEVEERREPLSNLIILAAQRIDGILVKLVLSLMPGLHVREQGIQQPRGHPDRAQYGLDLIEHSAFGNEELLIRGSRITADEIDVPALLEIASYRAARGRAFHQSPEHERLFGISRRGSPGAPEPNLFALAE